MVKRNAVLLAILGKDDFIPMNGLNVRVEARNRTSTEKCPGRFRWIKDRSLDFFLSQDPLHSFLPHELIVQPLFPGDVVVLKVN